MRRAVLFLFIKICSGFFIFSPGLLYAQQSELDKLAEEIRNQASQQQGRYFVGEELIFSLQVNRTKIGDVDALVMQDGIGFELETYFAALDFPIYFDASKNVYSGWYIREENTFNLSVNLDDSNAPYLEITASANSIKIPVTDYVYQDDRLYILERQFEQIFSIRHSLDNNKLTARLISQQGLPFLERLARKKGAIQDGQNNEPSFVNLPRGYELISPQILDIQANAIYRENTDDVTGSYSVQGVRDLALWRTSFSLAGNNRSELSSVRLNFGRDSVRGDLFGQSDITQFEFGDIRDVKQASGSSFNESLGFRISNAPLNTDLENNVIQLDGDIPVGWDAELYRNNVLIRQQLNIQTGRYNFLDVPLVFGANRFEIVLYGPQGQIRRKTTSRIVDGNSLSDKKFKYDVSFTDTSRSLINSEIDKFRLDSGYNLSGRINYSLGNNTNLDLGVRSQFGGENDNTLANIGFNTVLYDNILIGTSIAATSDNIFSFGTSARTLIGSQSLTFGASLNDITKQNGNATASVALNLDGSVGLTDSLKLPLNQGIVYRDNNTNEQFTYSNRVGFRLGRVSIFNSLMFDSIKHEDDERESILSGNINAQIVMGDFFLRTGASYSDNADKTFGAANINIGWNIMKGLRTNLNFQKDFQSDFDQTSLNISYINDHVMLSSNIGYSELLGYSFGINTSFSLSGKDSRIQSVSNSAFAQSSTGSLAVRVFLDNNFNAIYDTGDELIPNVEVKALQFYKKAITNDSGVALLSRLPDFKTSDIVINRDTLPDSFWMPSVEGVSITTRGGLVDFLDYPVVPSSEITGIVEIVQGDTLAIGARLKLNLIDSNGKLIDSTTSEFDGFYSFMDVTPGEYKIELDEASELRFGIKPYSIVVSVDVSSDVIDSNLTLQKFEFETLFVTEVVIPSNKRLSGLFITLVKDKLERLGMQLYVYAIPGFKSQQQIFYTAASKNKSYINDLCVSLNAINITCQATSVDIRKDV